MDHWLGPIRNVLRWNAQELNAIPDAQARFDRLVELNVLEQLYHLLETPIIQQPGPAAAGRCCMASPTS